MSTAIRCEIHQGVAVVTLDSPDEKVNILTSAFLRELESTARLLEQKRPTAAVVLSAKSGGFIAGADIREIQRVTDAAEGADLAREGQRIFGLWADLPFPVVAAIHGHCMGGGTEFALACGYRIAAPDATIALPEVRLGILPGFGGTQRLPRLISIEKALEMILTGRKVRAEDAYEIGLIDRVAASKGLLDDALILAREAVLDKRHLLAGRKSKIRGLHRWMLEKNAIGRTLLFNRAVKSARARSGGHYPAPPAIIEVMRKGLSLSLPKGLELEAIELGRLVVTPECKNLIHVYFLSQRPSKGPGLPVEARPLRKAAVLGAGTMGGGIAQLLADKGIPVLLKDILPEAVEAGLEHARRIFGKEISRKRKNKKAVSGKMEKITGTTSYEGFHEVDLVVEAVVEKMEVKQSVLQEVETHLPERAVFATNTSALSVSELQGSARRPGNVGGMHFFNPVHRMPLVEIIRGDLTSDLTAATLFEAARRLGKTPIIVADRPGFLVNRLLVAYLNEACLIAAAGVDWQSLDQKAVEFGLPMGPFRLIDEVGIDIATEVAKTLSKAFSYLPESPLLPRIVSSGLRGKKAGRGFYLHVQGEKPKPNRSVDRQLGLCKLRDATAFDMRKLLLLMVNEAGRCLEEKVVSTPEDVDTGMVFGAGFPPFRGGLCRWADAEGLSKLIGELEEISTDAGRRYEPCAYIKERKSFYR
jgi:3-hydroxyacyl-CoA dehydrogenase/enoyl-CoA hydratase/3-hydroxybutyryl-CoA epimerase